jgi:hypothetical protein
MRVLVVSCSEWEDEASILRFKKMLIESFESVIDRRACFIFRDIQGLEEFSYSEESADAQTMSVSLPGIDFVVVHGSLDTPLPWSERSRLLLLLIQWCLKSQTPCLMSCLGVYALVYLFSVDAQSRSTELECFLNPSTGDFSTLESNELVQFSNCGVRDTGIEARRTQTVVINRRSPHWMTAALPPTFEISTPSTTWRIASLPAEISLLASSELGPQIIAAGDLMVATAFIPSSAPEMKIILRNFASMPQATAALTSRVPCVPVWRVLRLPRLPAPAAPAAAAAPAPVAQRWGKVTVRKFLHPTVDNPLWEALES